MYKIISDGSCDFDTETAKELDVTIVPFYISTDGENYKKEIEELNIREFYNYIVSNPEVFPKTSLPTIQDYLDFFEPLVKEGISIICICISTKLSGSYNSAINAKNQILEDFPDANIVIVDSHMNTVLHGLYVREAVKLREAGADFNTLVSALDNIKNTGRIFFTVENIDYLLQGGRIGKLIGSATKTLNLRPLIVLRGGEIHPGGIARGRKKSTEKILDHMIKYIKENKNDLSKYEIAVGYGYDIEEGKKIYERALEVLKGEFPDSKPNIILSQIGATIAVHTGPHPLGFGIIEKA